MVDKVLLVEWLVTRIDDLDNKSKEKLPRDTCASMYFKGGEDTLQKLREKVLAGEFDHIDIDGAVG